MITKPKAETALNNQYTRAAKNLQTKPQACKILEKQRKPKTRLKCGSHKMKVGPPMSKQREREREVR